MKRYYIEVDVVNDEAAEFWPSEGAVAIGVGQGLPKEYFMEGDEWHIKALRESANPQALQDDLAAKRAEIAGLENALIGAQSRADGLEARNNDLIAAKVQVTTTYQSVGVTDDEAETLIDVLEGEVNGLQYETVDDISRAIDRFAGSIGDTVRDNLPVMDERDLGWGDDDQLQVLEAYAETLQASANGLIDKLDNIRTGR